MCSRLLSKSVLPLLCLLVSSFGASGQFNYNFSASAGTYTQLSSGTTISSIQADDAHSATINLGFTFNYDGVGVTQVKANSNGWLSMAIADAPTGAQGRDNSVMATANANTRPGIMPLWDDLDGTGGTAIYSTTGSAGSRVFTMEWRNYRWNWQATGAVISFQCKLYEGSNMIQFIYRREGTAVNSGTASIGLLGSSTGEFYSLNSTGASPVASTTTATVNLSSKPANGQVYQFVPCAPPTATTGAPIANCGNGTYSFPVTVSSMGSSGSVNIVATPGGTVHANVGTGTYSVGPYAMGTSVTIAVNGDAGCGTSLAAVVHTDAGATCHGSGVYTIPDNGCAASNVRNVPFCVSSTGTQLGTDVFIRSVDLIASHTYGSDLRFTLLAPNGNNIALVNSGHGGTGTQFGNASSCPSGLFTLQDGAASMAGMANNSTNVGTWAPDVPLSGLHDGSNPNGTWTLRACDAVGVDVGAVRYVRVNLCRPVVATLSRVNDCANNQFRAAIDVTSFGSGTSASITYSVNGGAPTQQNGVGLGTTLLGPFPSSAEVQVTVTNGIANCGSVQGSVFSTCPVTIDCGVVTNVEHCYRNNDTRTFTYLSPLPGETVTLSFVQGTIDLNDAVNVYNGTNNMAPGLGGGNFFGNLAGQTFTSTGPAIHFEITSNGTNSCADGGQGTPWQFEVKCTPGCSSPSAFIDVNNDCNSYSFTLDVHVLDTGDGATTDVVHTVNGGTPVTIAGVMPFDPINLGPFTVGDLVNITLLHESDPLCNTNLGSFTNTVVCPSAEHCVNALNLGTQSSPLAGTTIGRVADFSIACGTATANTAADAIYYIDVPADQQLNIRQRSNNYDSQHYVRYGGSCPGNTVIACIDDEGGEVAWVNWPNSTGTTQRVWWIQDGYAAGVGNFELEWNIETCPTPTASAATNILSNGAAVNYNGFAGNYIIEYGPSATFTTPGTGVTAGPNGTVVNVTSSPFQLTGLNPNTGYRYFVRRDCGASFSSNSNGITFTTLSGVSVSNGACGLNHAIPDNGCGSSNSLNALITLSGLNPALGVNVVLESVDLIISHTSRSQLQVRLTSPTGQTRNMILQRGGSGDNFGNTASCPSAVLKLVDGGASLASMSTSTNNITGNFAPEQSLAGFTGNPNGVWTLSICDNAFTFLSSQSLRHAKLNFAPLDCQGVANGTALPGTPCNDGDACTVNDTWSVACACVGTFQDSDNDGTCDANDGCPTDPNKIAAGACGCGVADVPTTYYADTDGDGAGDPASPLAGFTCTVPPGHVTTNNDGCPTDSNKTAPGICGCGVSDLDSDNDGTPDCNDACPNDPLKLSPGQCGCDIADTDSDADGTADCNDGCPNDPLKIAPGTCGCGVADVDTDGDGLADCVDNCPNLAGVIGSPCDDGNALTILDRIDASCTCSGTACSEQVNFELNMDVNGSQISWRIAQEGTGTVVCSGGISPAYPNNVPFPIVESCCLPVGCYTLEVYDSAGDGIVGGGYQLRETGANGRRIIDNTGNFTSGSISSIPGGQDFCVPMGTDALLFSSCDKMDWVNNKYVVVHANPAVSAMWIPGGSNAQQPANSGYEFWIYDPNGSYSYRRFRAHNVSDGFSPATANRACHMKLNGWNHHVNTPHVPANTLLNIKVRGRVNAVNLPFGPACKLKIDPVRAMCPLVKLQDDPANTSDYSCGVMRVWGGANSTLNKIVANPPQFSPAPSGPVRYQFRFRIPGEGFCTIRPPQSSPTLHLNWTNGTALECGKQYEVDVRVSKDGGATWCVDGANPSCDPGPVTPWGKACVVTIANCLQGGRNSALATQGNGSFTMYPNPNRGDQLFINLTNVGSEVNTASVDIYDLTGKRVIARTIAVQDGLVNTTLQLNGDLAGGVYLVNITAGTKTHTERLVIQP